ncbi:polysaccharide pyruvyl transferase family protein [Leuconostoc lactis]|uniref:polysaccharide pyruvyl transferase family protein n=1 Tax=Leuconostoc lactis TaxID=1246 RepID=UPI003745737F
MKLAIHTISDDNNFGNRLQNFALQKVLNSRYGETKTLQDIDSKRNYYSIINEFSVARMTMPFNIIRLFLNGGTKSEFLRSIKEYSRQRVFRNFTKEYVPKFRKKNIGNQIDYFIIGSDQVWNPNFRRNLSKDFLPCVHDKKIISYAASVGLNKLSKSEEAIFRDGLKHLSAISVREYTAQTLLGKIVDNEITVLIDPTMLVSADEWHELSERANNEVKKQKNFLVTYFLGKISINEKKYINEYAQKNRLKIIDISDVSSRLYAKIGPLEFLWLFENAAAVFSDSFHAAVFSLIFQKYFEIFERHDTLPQMNTRMHTLFQHFSLEDRIRNVESENGHLSEIDYERISNLINIKRSEAFVWLDENLKESRT